VENGGFGDIGRNLIILVPIILLLIFNVFFKRRKGEKTQPEIVFSLLSEIALNQQIVETFLQGQPVKKFKTGSWQRNKNKLDFLEQELQVAVAKVFSMAEEFNREIDSAKKFKSSSYLIGIPADKLKELLAHSRQWLEEWLQSHSGQTQATPGRRGLFS
jgi:hypothetical protein